MRKLFLLFAFLMANVVLESCCNEPDECFDIELTGLSSYDVNQNLLLQARDTVKARQYGIQVQANGIERSCAAMMGWGAGLYAINCDGPYIIMQDEVTNISITSSGDLGANYLAGSELKSLFIPIDIDTLCLTQVDNSSECIRDYSQVYTDQTIEQIFNYEFAVDIYYSIAENFNPSAINLLALQINEPFEASSHQFTLTFTFESGQTNTFTTEEIFLRP